MTVIEPRLESNSSFKGKLIRQKRRYVDTSGAGVGASRMNLKSGEETIKDYSQSSPTRSVVYGRLSKRRTSENITPSTNQRGIDSRNTHFRQKNSP